MALLMVAPMAVLMIALMRRMYPNRKRNSLIVVTALLTFVLALVLLRTQEPIHDIQYMKAMIPHHSSALMTSKNADLSDPEVKKLAEQIIHSQEQEIEQMKAMLDRIEKR